MKSQERREERCLVSPYYKRIPWASTAEGSKIVKNYF